MMSLLRKAAFFLAGLAGLLIVAAIYYELRVRQPDDFFRQVAWFSDPAVKPVVLLIGDSRMALNVDPRRLPPGFYNFSFPGDTLRHLYLRAKFALETKPSIRYLVIGIEDVNMSEARARLREVDRYLLFADLTDLTEVYPSSPRFLLRNAVLHYFPLVNATYRGLTAEALVNDVRWTFTGHVPEPKEPRALICGGFEFTQESGFPDTDGRDRNAQAAERVRELYGESLKVAEMGAVFRKIVMLANSYDVKVIAVRNPLSEPYLLTARQYDNGATLAAYGHSELHATLNYETLLADKMEYFFNLDHLNHRGSARFTERLVSDLESLVFADDKTLASADGKTLASANEKMVAPCDVQSSAAPPGWPYNDVISAWLGNPDCHNLRGDCGAAPELPTDGLQYADKPEPDGEGPAIDDPEQPSVRPPPRLTSQGAE